MGNLRRPWKSTWVNSPFLLFQHMPILCAYTYKYLHLYMQCLNGRKLTFTTNTNLVSQISSLKWSSTFATENETSRDNVCSNVSSAVFTGKQSWVNDSCRNKAGYRLVLKKLMSYLRKGAEDVLNLKEKTVSCLNFSTHNNWVSEAGRFPGLEHTWHPGLRLQKSKPNSKWKGVMSMLV